MFSNSRNLVIGDCCKFVLELNVRSRACVKLVHSLFMIYSNPIYLVKQNIDIRQERQTLSKFLLVYTQLLH